LPTNGIYDNEVSALAVSYTNANVIYAARRIRFEYSSPSSIYVTTNGGSNWTDITSNLPDSLYYTSVDVSQTNAAVAYVALGGLVAGQKIYKTINSGLSWQNISLNLPNVPVNCVKTVPGTGELLVGTDLGVYMLNAAGTTWVSKNTGLPNVIVSDIEFNPILNKIYVATFGRGIWETDLSSMVGANDISDNEIPVELYPSPNNGSFTISLPDELLQKEQLQLTVIDVMGRKVYSSTLRSQLNKLELDLPSGLYFAKISGSRMNGVKSFVIK
jgi:hypothetical protein